MKKLTNKLTNSQWTVIEQEDNSARFQSTDKSVILNIEQTGKDEYDVWVYEEPYYPEYYTYNLEEIIYEFC